MPLHNSPLGEMPLQKPNLEKCHYNSHIPLYMPFLPIPVDIQLLYSCTYTYTAPILGHSGVGDSIDKQHVLQPTRARVHGESRRGKLRGSRAVRGRAAGRGLLRRPPRGAPPAEGRARASPAAGSSGRRASRSSSSRGPRASFSSSGLLQPPRRTREGSRPWAAPAAASPSSSRLQLKAPLAAARSSSRLQPRLLQQRAPPAAAPRELLQP